MPIRDQSPHGDQAGAIAGTGEPTVPGPRSEMRLPGRTALTQAQVRNRTFSLPLKWQDVDFERAKLYVRRSVWHGNEQTPKSRRSIRAKYVLYTVAQALIRHKKLSLYTEPESYVFATGAGKPLDPNDVRNQVLYPAMDAAGIERTVPGAYGFHLFRHSAASELHEATHDLKQTQSFLGHSGVAITADVYVHLQPDAEIEAMKKLEASVFPEVLLFPNCSQNGNLGKSTGVN